MKKDLRNKNASLVKTNYLSRMFAQNVCLGNRQVLCIATTFVAAFLFSFA